MIVMLGRSDSDVSLKRIVLFFGFRQSSQALFSAALSKQSSQQLDAATPPLGQSPMSEEQRGGCGILCMPVPA